MAAKQTDIDDVLPNPMGSAAVAALPESSSPKPPVAPAGSAARHQVPSQAGCDLERILRIEVPVIVKLAECQMPMSRVLGLSPGAIIEFEKPSDDPLDLLINNKRIASGQAVKVGENFGLRILGIGTLQDKIAALAGR